MRACFSEIDLKVCFPGDVGERVALIGFWGGFFAAAGIQGFAKTKNRKTSPGLNRTLRILVPCKSASTAPPSRSRF